MLEPKWLRTKYLSHNGYGRVSLGRIICVAIWTLYKLCAPLTSAEAREIPIASRNKLRFTSLWGPIFKDFGKPNGLPNSIFQALFFDVSFHCV